MTVSQQTKEIAGETVTVKVQGNSKHHKQMYQYLEKKLESLNKQIELKKQG